MRRAGGIAALRGPTEPLRSSEPEPTSVGPGWPMSFRHRTAEMEGFEPSMGF